MANKPISSALADGDTGQYDTAEAAAIAGLRSINEKKTEVGGGILYNPDTKKYAYTQPVGQGDGYHFGAHIQVPQGWQLEALYHTHPQGPSSTQFSMDDVSMAQQLRKPSYILPAGDDTIRKFDPSDPTSNRVVRNGFDPARSYANGAVVDEGPPLDGTPRAHPGTVLMPKPPVDKWGRSTPIQPQAPAQAANIPVQGSMGDPYAAFSHPLPQGGSRQGQSAGTDPYAAFSDPMVP